MNLCESYGNEQMVFTDNFTGKFNNTQQENLISWSLIVKKISEVS